MTHKGPGITRQQTSSLQQTLINMGCYLSTPSGSSGGGATRTRHARGHAPPPEDRRRRDTSSDEDTRSGDHRNGHRRSDRPQASHPESEGGSGHGGIGSRSRRRTYHDGMPEDSTQVVRMKPLALNRLASGGQHGSSSGGRRRH